MNRWKSIDWIEIRLEYSNTTAGRIYHVEVNIILIILKSTYLFFMKK